MSEKIGKFISIHGIDGTGKTSTAKEIVDVLKKSGEKVINYDIYKESVKNPHATRKREIKETGTLEDQLAIYLESMMFHSTQIEKFLSQNYHVVKSRYLEDIKAHFSHLGVGEEKIKELEGKFPMVQPDLKVILLLDEIKRRSRISERGALNGRDLEEKNPQTPLEILINYFYPHEL